ncbi:ESPR-type extended signal peptide-containing protein [Moraxella pluranimalium]|uniref:Autotransporter adhesin n=1 Tax=Moraxella pluranimalium TaxID=470453 RepID=A0A1T0CUA1_9GAMM|nr:YadA-like family protein [Moraxella pluranimalium]OOS25935.1 hypothetical protein B0680_00810 [Moraxella pluranimalium]
MNKVYKVIWNHATQTWVAVSEIAQAKGKTSSKTDKRAKLSKAAAVVSLAVAGSAVISGQAYAATTAPASTQYCLQQGGVTTSCADYNVQSNGGNVHVQGAGTVAGLGAGSNPSGWGTSIGADSTAGAGATALGYNAEATGTESSALGANTVASGKHSLAIGSSNQPATAAEATAERSVAVGHNSSSTATDAIAMGTSATASGASATALGRNTTATKAGATAVGNEADATGDFATATGHESVASGTNATATGAKAKATGTNSVASGVNSTASATGAIAIGNSSVASGEKSTAIGDGAKVLSGAVNSTAIGTGSTIQGTSTNAYSLGTNNSIGASNAAAVGSNNVIQPSASNTMVLGNNVTATRPNSVILGEGSTDRAYTEVTSVTIPNLGDGLSIVYDGFTGTATGVVSIGSKGKERQLTNVAPGEISATSTDTINGSQLYAVAYKLGEQISSTYFHANINETNQGAGDPVTNKGRIMDKAGATGAYAVTAGVNSTATAQKATAVGYGTKASDMYATALGVAAEASAQAATAIGTNSVAKSIDSIALGNASKAEHQKSIAIGDRSHTTGEDSMAIGAVASASAPNAYAIGSQAVASGVGSTAIGSRSNSSARRALAIGVQSVASGELAVAFGQTSEARGASSVALGSDSRATEAADSGIAIGNGSRVLAANATAIGRKSIIAAGADNATAVGANSAIMDNAQNAQAFGASNTVASSNATVIGARNLVKEDAAYSSAVGNDNTITSANTFVLGSGIGRSSTDLAVDSAEGTVANSVYLGNESEVTKGAGSVDGNGVGSLKTWNKDQQSGATATTAGANGTVETAKVGGVTYGSASVGGQAFAGAATTGAVSVGSSGAERRIQNVAAGEISKTSTDAINGSQLYAVAHQASKPITFKANSNKDGANATMGYASLNGLERILGDEINIKGASTSRDLSRNSDAATAGAYSARNVQTVVDDQGVQIQIATNPIFDSVQFGSNSGPKITNEGANIKVGDSTGAATKITNVANGTNANDAVNLSQLNATRAVVAAGDNTHITAEDIAGGGKTYTVHADKAVVQAGNGISLETNPTTNGNGTVTTTYTVKANVDDTTIGITADGKLYSKVSNTDTNTDTSAHVKAADGSLVTVTKADATRADGITQITDYTVDITKGAFNGVTTAGKLNADGTTAGVATVGDVITAVNSGYWTANVNGNTKVADVKFGDSLNFVDGVATAAAVKNGGVTFNVKTDGTTIKVDDQGNLAVNPNVLPKPVEVLAGNNTNVVKGEIGGATTYTIDAEKSVVTTGTGLELTTTAGANNVTTYNVALDQATQDQLAKVETVVAGDSGLVTVTSPNNNDTGGKEFKVDITKGVFNTATNPTGSVAAPTKDGVATTNDVVNAINQGYWTAQVGGTELKPVHFGDTLNFVNGNGTKAVAKEGAVSYDVNLVSTDSTVTFTPGTDGAVDIKVNTANLPKTVVQAGTGPVEVSGDGTTANPYEVSVKTTAVTPSADQNTNGSVATVTDPSAVMAAGDVINTIKNAGFKLTASANGGAETGSTIDSEVINAGDTVDMAAGKNLVVKQEANGKITYATADDVTFNNVTTSNLTATGDTVVKNFTVSPDSVINMGNNQITNVKAGTDDTDAVNVKQLNDTVKAARTKVEAGTNVEVTNVTNDATGEITYTINAKDTTATASVKDGSSEFLTVTANGTKSTDGTTTTDYAVGLTDKAKDVLNNAATKVEDTNTVDLTLTNGVLKADVKAVDGKGTKANITANGLTFDVKTDGNTITFDKDGNLTVNTDNLPKTKLVDGKNTTVEGSGTDADPYKVNVKGDLTDITSISNGDTTIKLGDAIVNVGGATITNVANGTKAGDAVNYEQLQASQEEVVSTDKSVTITEGKTDKGAKKFDLSVNTDGTTIVKNADGELTVATTPLTNTATGTVNVPTGDEASKLATAVDIANAINNSGFTIKANGDTGALVKPGDEVDFVNGKNISITRSGTSLTVATVDTPVFTSVQFNENGPIIKADASNNINVGKSDGSATKITNVAAGVDDNDAVNVKQLQDTVAANKTAIKAGNNVDITGEGTTASPYVINAKDTTATASVKDGSSEFLTVTTNGTTTADGTTTTDYAVGLTDKAKEVLTNAATKVEDTNTVDLTLTNGVLKADVKAVDGKGTTANVTTNGLTFDIKTDGNTITFDKDGNLTVNTDNLPKTKLVDGKNTTVEGSGTDADPYKVNVKGDLTDITSISNGDTTIKLGDAIVNVGGATISNVKAGVDDNDAVNVKQLQDTVAAAKTYVKAGDNTEVTGAGTQADPYTVHAEKTTASAGSTYVTVTAEPKANHTTNYSIDLSKDTKDKIEAATKVNNVRETVVAGNNIVVTTATNDTGGKEFTVKTADDINVNSVNASTVTVGDVKIDSNGIDAGGKTITNVGAGVNATDAVNVSQLTGAVTNINNRIDGVEGRVNELDSRVRGLGAISAASSSLPQVYLPGKSMVAVAAGGYGGAQAVAVGFSSTSDNGRLLMKIQGSASTDGDKSGGVGVGWMW